MCWISKFPPKEQIAEKDIEVEKVLEVIGNTLGSPICPKVWKKGEVEIEPVNFNNIEPDSIFKDYRINKGFHSAKKIDYYSNDFSEFFFSKYKESWCSLSPKGIRKIFTKGDADKIFKAIIPKGARYCVNEYLEYVSDKLIIL